MREIKCDICGEKIYDEDDNLIDVARHPKQILKILQLHYL